MGAKYHFVTDIRLTATQSQVWEALYRAEGWPEWWRWLKAVAILDEGDNRGVGRKIRNTVGSPLGYTLTYVGTSTHVVEPELLEFSASGDLLGTGQFRLSADGEGASQVLFNWLVETPKWWMNLLAPLARPLFTWNHDRLMTQFANGLAVTTGGNLVAVANHTISPGTEGFYQL